MTALDLNALLTAQGHDPEQVIVMRHRPYEPKLNKVFPWLAEERIDLFDAYQQCQDEKVETALLSARHVASFIGTEAATATFVGLYEIVGHVPLTREAYWEHPAHRELRELGMVGWKDDELRTSILRFDLRALGFYANWKGKLRIGWPPPERSWWRRAHRNIMPVLSIAEESMFAPKAIVWSDLVLSWQELQVMPGSMKARLSQWRGIYLIRDASDGLYYVGSAGGGENLLGRWTGYATSGHGGNRLLRARDPANFSFSILQLTAQDMPPDELVALESSWKRRLQTRSPNGLNDN